MVKLGYRCEPHLLVGSFAMTVFTAVPDALVALWLALLADGLVNDHPNEVWIAAVGLAFSATGTWYLRVVFDRVQRRFRDRVGIALESHVARLQASVSTIEHQERPDYLDRLAVLRDQVFSLDHMFMSLFSTVGWIMRLVFVAILLASVHLALLTLVLLAVPTAVVATWRPAVERDTEEHVASRDRLAKHLFTLGTTAPSAKEIRLSGIRGPLLDHRRAAWEEWYRPVARVRWSSALWQTAAWTIFGLGYVGAIVFVASGLARIGRSPCCSSWWPAVACRSTSDQRSASSGSCGASGSTRLAAWRGSRTTPPPSTRTRTSPRPTASSTASASRTCRSTTPAPSARCSTTSTSTCRPARSSPSWARTGPARPPS